MIRPFTVICFLLACGSGLYLYQTKHRVQMLDREIEKTVHATEATRDQARLLGAEWMLLNDPERLRSLSDQFLALRSVTPGQFTTLADLDHRLPAVRGPDAPLEPVPEPAVMTPMVPPPVAEKDSPAPPAATPEPAAAPTAPRVAPVVAERKPAPDKPAPRVATAQAEPKSAEPKPPAETRTALLAPAPPRATPAPHFSPPITPVVAAMAGGSALGMASRTSSLPPPVPIGAGPKPISLFPASDH